MAKEMPLHNSTMLLMERSLPANKSWLLESAAW
jgi:hypothetical protein